MLSTLQTVKDSSRLFTEKRGPCGGTGFRIQGRIRAGGKLDGILVKGGIERKVHYVFDTNRRWTSPEHCLLPGALRKKAEGPENQAEKLRPHVSGQYTEVNNLPPIQWPIVFSSPNSSIL